MFSQFVFVGLFFVVLMIGMLWDLGVFSKTTEVEVSAKQAIKHTAVWFGIGLLMTVAVYFFHGQLHQISTLQDLQRYASQYRVDLELGRGFEYAMSDFSRTSSICDFVDFSVLQDEWSESETNFNLGRTWCHRAEILLYLSRY